MTRFRRNPLFEQQLRASARYERALNKVARSVAEEVRQAAPIGDSGAYSRSIRAVDNRVESTDPFAHLVEFGSVNNPPYAPIRRGVRAAGLELDEK